MPEPKDGTENPESSSRFAFHEFLVDFLGGLVPGMLFTVAASAALVPGFRGLLAAVSPSVNHPTMGTLFSRFMESTRDTPNMIWIGAFVFMLMFSYLIGHLFYRRDPKVPDRASFRLISKDPDDEAITDCGGDIEQWKRQSFGCTTEENCQFPYPSLDVYLGSRGHKHLLPLVNWMQRSKTHINRLKIRLEFHYPAKYRRVIRNEAHVRLATSTWYAAKALYWVCSIAIFAATIGLFVAFFRSQFATTWDAISWFLHSILWPITVLALAWYSQHATERFLHYQRLREVFYVLELAYTAFRDNPSIIDLEENCNGT